MSGEQPSSLEFRARLLSQQGIVGLGRRIRLQVTYENWTGLARRLRSIKRKVITWSLSGCAEHNKVQISGSTHHPRGGLWPMDFPLFRTAPACIWREQVTSCCSWKAKEDSTELLHPFCLPSVSRCPFPPYLLSSSCALAITP